VISYSHSIRKTSTVAVIIRTLVSRGCRVLVSSYTHSAVDNLLCKLLDAGFPPEFMVRLGTTSSVNARVQPLLVVGQDDNDLQQHQQQQQSIAALKGRLDGARIVGCTVLTAARHALLQGMSFDWCIMDEAGQIAQPAAIGPLHYCSKFILIGDDYQLPPLIVSLEAKSLVSLD
jgi:DNA replication ATP-dependent helicase Dna2